MIVGAATSISSSQCIGAEMAHTFLSYVEGEEEEEEEEDSSSDDAAIDDDDEVDLTRSLTDELCLATPRAPTAAGLLLSTYFTLMRPREYAAETP